MVFLGGAVLANIVSLFTLARFSKSSPIDESADGRQRQHVDLEARMARARTADIREAWS